MYVYNLTPITRTHTHKPPTTTHHVPLLPRDRLHAPAGNAERVGIFTIAVERLGALKMLPCIDVYRTGLCVRGLEPAKLTLDPTALPSRRRRGASQQAPFTFLSPLLNHAITQKRTHPTEIHGK